MAQITNIFSRSGIIFDRVIFTKIFLILGIINHKKCFHVCVGYTPSETTVPFSGPLGTHSPCRPYTRPGFGSVAHCRIFAIHIKISKYRVHFPFYCSGGIALIKFTVTGLQKIERVQVCPALINSRIGNRNGIIFQINSCPDHQCHAIEHFNTLIIIRPF